jgi:ribulose-phosphate 3-epimerase
MTRTRAIWTGLLVVYAGFIFALSSLPLGKGPPLLSFPGRDWVLHAFEFGLFFVLARNAIGRTSIALLVTALYAGSDEFHQAFVPARDASLVDFGFDLLGACTAAAATALARRALLSGKIARRILGARASGREKGNHDVFRTVDRSEAMKLAPSLLSADFADLRTEALSVAALADRYHWDVMDGHFVPNLTFGPPVVNALRGRLDLPFDIHLMIDRPATYAPQFHVKPEDALIFHLEASDPPRAAIDAIRRTGARVGISLRPKVSLDALAPFLDEINLVLIMSVEPGFGGQAFLPEALERIAGLKRRIDGRSIEIAVDGGITLENVLDVVSAGADVIVAGSAIFAAADRAAAMRALLEAVSGRR